MVSKNHFINIFIINIIDYKQDLFIYIIIKYYTPKEFYNVIINIGTFKKFTAGYRQYLIYRTTINNNMDINITQTRAVNI